MEQSCLVLRVKSEEKGTHPKPSKVKPKPTTESRVPTPGDWAVRSQLWADFAQTKICYGARTRLSLRRTTTSSRARCSMLPNPKTQDLQCL